ncbi:cation diffusion facilitator family transporter [Aerococcus sp. UMB7834]|uniref:cation diffusion facilitator family transporter n=1 Tax=Aerococcus sp. UMB7834 TaxID=3046342 RepID=UPI002550BF48|nr:cation diffusion facilitator family transporter [Aerococcus sp. UMB7834]MDK6805761.1 cation diffusion facilitator family transporter [Aerococcus sp. UMB7834]
MPEQSYEQVKRAERATWLSIASYLIIATAKLLGGYFFRSSALTADGMNNLSDTINAVFMFIGLRFSRKPADSDHRYGHWKAESIATLAMSFLILYIGLEVTLNSLQNFFHYEPVTPDPLTIGVALVSGLVMLGVYLYNKRLAKQLESQALLASSKDNLTDALTSFMTAFTALTSQFGLPWLDGVMALVIGLIILKTGFDIFVDSTFQLTDGFPVDLIETYEEEIAAIPDIHRVRHIAARRYGANVYIDVTILVDPSLSVKEGHDITEKVEHVLADAFAIQQVDVHVEPDL